MKKYKYTADSTFQIGTYHVNSVSPCQDYAQTYLGPEGDSALLVISDGCSSGGQTDVGARILAHKFLVKAKERRATIPTKAVEVNLTNKDLKYLGLEIEDFLATLVTIEANQNMVQATVIGDGVFVLQLANGTRYIYQIEWANNAPAYPVYFSEAGKAAGMPQRFIDFHMETSQPHCIKMLVVKPDSLEEQVEYKAIYQEAECAPNVISTFPHGCDVVMAAIFSDGIDQVRHVETGERISVVEAVDSCLSFKNTTGSFVKRRIRKQIADWKKLGYEPFDDLSCAVLMLEQIDDGEEVSDGN